MLTLKPITIWEVVWRPADFMQREPADIEFNHIEDGHAEGKKPIPKSAMQKQCWPNQQWQKERAYLDQGGRVIRIEVL